MEYGDFTSYMGLKRDPSVTDALQWLKGSYPNMSKMARDVMAVPTMGAGIERELGFRPTTRQSSVPDYQKICPFTMKSPLWILSGV